MRIEKAKHNFATEIAVFQILMAYETVNIWLKKETVTKGVTLIFDKPEINFTKWKK